MKINSLKIEGFNVLEKDFFIDFSNSSNLSVLIGKNGSGKSSILEVVGLIFKSLYKGTKTSFKFVIDYELYEQKIAIQYNDENFIIRVNANVYYLSDTDYLKDRGIKLLPDNIIAYYSGSNIRLKNIFNFGRYVQSPFLYVEDKHFKLILLTLLSSNLPLHKEFLSNNFYVSIDNSFSFELNLQLFSKKLIRQIMEIDENFIFYLKQGINIRDLFEITKQNISNNTSEYKEIILDKLHNIWQNVIANRLFEESLNKSYKFKDNTFQFSFNFEELENFLYIIGGEIDFFKNILDLTSKGILTNVNFKFKKNSNFVDYTAFSEGERQLLTVVGLKKLISGESNLFLLDEPDTYLHPSWQNLLIESLSNKYTNDKIIMTTHSAKLLGYIENKSMFILENGQWVQDYKNVYGRDINWITEYVMEDKPRKVDIIEKIQKVYTLIEEEEYKKADISIKELENLIGSNDKDLEKLKTILDFSRE